VPDVFNPTPQMQREQAAWQKAYVLAVSTKPWGQEAGRDSKASPGGLVGTSARKVRFVGLLETPCRVAQGVCHTTLTLISHISYIKRLLYKTCVYLSIYL
jgi:hypothetical protein